MNTLLRHSGKIFGIGLPKTGTSSLNRALGILGYRSAHFPNDAVTVAELKAGRYDLSILRSYDALTDVPVPAIFAQLDMAWPGSKFILTIRDPVSWLESCRNAPFNREDELPDAGSTREFYRVLLYGTVAYQPDRFAWVYATHVRNVMEHFTGAKSDQLLILDLVGGEGWEKLCSFLSVPEPGAPFPHDNPRSRRVDLPDAGRKPGQSRHRRLASIFRLGR
jgi:hypothetical protein